MNENWTLDVKNSYALGNYERVKALTAYGIKNYTDYVEEKDIHLIPTDPEDEFEVPASSDHIVIK